MVVIDTTMLMLLLRPGIPVPPGPDGNPIQHPKERIEFLVSKLQKAKSKLIIPAPALSEALVRAGTQASADIVEYLNKYTVFKIEPFDTRAAIEVAAMTRTALASKKKKGDSDSTWAKIKYDRQIVAIAKVCGVEAIYSDDRDVAEIAKKESIQVIGLADLPVPQAKLQGELQLEGHADGQFIPEETEENRSSPT